MRWEPGVPPPDRSHFYVPPHAHGFEMLGILRDFDGRDYMAIRGEGQTITLSPLAVTPEWLFEAVR
jgi:hypothetical protein